jgi:hypothetical protein
MSSEQAERIAEIEGADAIANAVFAFLSERGTDFPDGADADDIITTLVQAENDWEADVAAQTKRAEAAESTLAEQAALIEEAKEVARRIARVPTVQVPTLDVKDYRVWAAALLTRLEGEGQ